MRAHTILWIVWLVLIAATLVSAALSGEAGASPSTGVTVLALAFMKVQLVIWFFMEIRTAPLPWKIAFTVWSVTMAGILGGLHLSG